MPLQPTVISYSSQGLTKNKDAFNLSDDAYQQLDNAYVWRGRILRRRGYNLLGRLRRRFTASSVGNWDSGTLTYNLITLLGITGEPNASIQPGTVANPITITIAAPGSTILTDTAGTGILASSNVGNIASATINYATGVVTIVIGGAWAASATTVTMAYFPTLPVMGLTNKQLVAINSEDTVAFDTKYAYIFDTGIGAWIEYPTTPAAGITWLGNDSDFFWSASYWFVGVDKLIWTTNFNKGATPDPIRYNVSSATTWITFAPIVTTAGTIRLQQCRIIIPYRGRLVVLNTWEGANLAGSTQNPQRARWSQLGDPTDQTSGWLSDAGNPGRGGFVDAATNEHIVAADFVRDTLVVAFESSTWALRYTGNEIQPFVWERINKDLGAESTFSMLSMDKGIAFVGDKSINGCNGNSVLPIDESIPDEVFEFHNGNDGPKRVHAARDFISRQIYWTFPDQDEDTKFPNRLLVYNYENGSWAFFTDSFTCLGMHQPSQDATWASSVGTTWAEAKEPWNTGSSQSKVPKVIGGNQQGWVFLLTQKNGNDPSLQITGITAGTPPTITIPNHNLQALEIIRITGVVGLGSALNNLIFRVKTRVSDSQITLEQYTALTDNYDDVALAAGGTYSGLGVVERIFNFSVRSKKFNMLSQGTKRHLRYIDFLMDTTEGGEITCLLYRDYADGTSVNEGDAASGAPDPFFNTVIPTTKSTFTGGAVTKQWHRFYCQLDASFIEYELTFSDAQMNSLAINNSDVTIDAVVLYSDGGGRLVE